MQNDTFECGFTFFLAQEYFTTGELFEKPPFIEIGRVENPPSEILNITARLSHCMKTARD